MGPRILTAMAGVLCWTTFAAAQVGPGCGCNAAPAAPVASSLAPATPYYAPQPVQLQPLGAPRVTLQPVGQAGAYSPYGGAVVQAGACCPQPAAGYPAAGACCPPIAPQPVYALRPVLPVIPASNGAYVGRGLLGQPKAYIDGQPVLNFFRYVLP